MEIYKSGMLDNTTLVRFTHASSSGAGTESHIECLNKILLQRNKMTIYYLYMPENNAEIQTQFIGKGKLIRVPMKYTLSPLSLNRNLLSRILFKCKSFLPGFEYIPQFRDVVHLHSITEKLFSESKIDLLVNHFAGSRGSLEIMKEMTAKNIPVLVINHFHNKWFYRAAIRKQLKYAAMAAGMSNVCMPRYLQNRFVNLSNGIDTDFFNPELVETTKVPFTKPTLLLPARVVKNKGHIDLLKILYHLKKHGLNCSLVFAGRYDSSEFKTQLDNFIQKHHLESDVLFTGILSPESLRLWYAKSTLMVLPTYHDEGLPRVVLESQAMGLPPVCYDSGGVAESILQGQTGYYLKKGDRGGMQKCIARLLTDDKKRSFLSKNGRKFILNSFSLNSLACRHELTYFRLIHSISEGC